MFSDGFAINWVISCAVSIDENRSEKNSDFEDKLSSKVYSLPTLCPWAVIVVQHGKYQRTQEFD